MAGLKTNYKTITLPISQVKVVVRPLKAYDHAHIGRIPDVMAENAERRKQAEADAKNNGQQISALETLASMSAEEIDYVAKRCCRAVVRVIPERVTKEEKTVLVSKQPADCGPNEFSFYDLEDGDSTALIAAAFEGDTGEMPESFLKKEG